MGSNNQSAIKVIDEKEKSRELKKHVATVHCAGKLSLLQRKISNALLYHAYDHLLEVETHQISIRQLCQLIGCNSNNYDVIKKALKVLIATVVEWNVVDNMDCEEDWSASSILASVRIKEGICSYSYSPRMRELLHAPSMYAKIDLGLQSRFQSNYGLALYENCIRYQALPHTRWFELDTFRKLMGIPDDKYVVFRDFKRRVLDKAVEEVNTYSNLRIEPEVIRQGKKVLKLRFHLEQRAKKTPLGVKAQQQYDNDLLKQLVGQYHFSETHAKKILAEYSSAFVKEKIELLESNAQKSSAKKIRNSAAYLISALQNDYHTTPSNNDRVVASLPNEQEMKDAYEEYLREEILRKYNTTDEGAKRSILQKFESSLGGGGYLELFQREGLQNVLITDHFIDYLRMHHPECCSPVQSFREFCLRQEVK